MASQTSVTQGRPSLALPQRRWRAHSLAGAALALLVSALLAGCVRSDGTPQDGTEQWKQMVVEGLAIRIPPTWSARRLAVHCVRSGPGVLVSNLDASSFERDVPPALGGCTTRWKVEGASRDFVLVDVSRFKYPVAGSTPGDSALPPELETSSEESKPCECTFEFADLWLNAISYNVRVWIGQDTRESDRQSLDAMISSIRPTRTSD